MSDDRYASHEVMAAADITYRQLDHWARLGYLSDDHVKPGSGHVRAWSLPELCRAVRISALVKAGFRVEKAAELTGVSANV